jgi:ribonuclease-3
MLGRRTPTPFEKRIGYRFRDEDLLSLALTHRSYANEQGVETHYERLEFLGDAVLGLITTEWLYRNLPDLPEGDLTKRKNHLVSKDVLAPYAEQVKLGEVIRLGVGEERSGGRAKFSLLANSMEAVFGAVYLDGGIEAARSVILPMLIGGSGELAPAAIDRDAKTRLQEVAQGRGWPLPEYRLAAESGPDHSKVFSVECWVHGECAGQGEGPSKKIAEQRAAAAALTHLTPP